MKQSPYRNGWTRETILKQIEEKNGFKLCVSKKAIKQKSVCGLKYPTMCRYRHYNKQCFAGAFIPDDKYCITMEGHSIRYIIDKHGISHLMPLDVRDMLTLQNIHDDFGHYGSRSIPEDHLTLKDRLIEFLDDIENRP